MRVRWLLLSILSVIIVLLASSPAWTSGLDLLRFDRTQNRLEFKTDRPVQPSAHLLDDPTRLVIDLPGILLDEPTMTQPIGGAVRHLRAVQLDDQTTRLVLELAPDYLLDPKQIRFRGLSPSHWSVQLPAPQRQRATPAIPIATPATAIAPTPSPVATTIAATPTTPLPTATPATHSTVTASSNPEISLGLTPNRAITINTLPPLPPISLPPASSPPPASPNPTLSTVALAPPTPAPQLATIQAIELDITGGQLLIQTDRPVGYQGQWQGSDYRIRLAPARLVSNLRGPQLAANSPLQRIRLQQDDAQTVSIIVLPAPGVRIDQLNPVSSQLLALQLRQPPPPVVTPPVVTAPPPSSRANPSSRPVTTLPPTGSPPPVQPPEPSPAPSRLPPANGQVPSRQAVVMIDPGHGGPDPGAIGIGGLREKDVVLPISLQTAAILQQQGVLVMMTRVDDRDLGLEPRVQMAEQVRATLFVSIHANSIGAGNPGVNGLETYYYASGDRLAQVIHRHILQFTGARDRGVKQARFYVLRKTSMPSVLVETGFVSGYEDAARLQNPASQSQIAGAIATGILQYLYYLSTGR